MKIINTGDKTVSKKRRVRNKKRLILTGVLVLAIVIVLILYLVVSSQAGKQTKEKANDTPQPMKVLTGDEISSQIEKSDNTEEKAKLYLDLASTKQGEGKNQEALDAANKSIELKPTHEAYAIAGAIHKANKNTDMALEMYQKALGLAEKTEDPNEVSPYNNYRAEITDMGGQV